MFENRKNSYALNFQRQFAQLIKNIIQKNIQDAKLMDYILNALNQRLPTFSCAYVVKKSDSFQKCLINQLLFLRGKIAMKSRCCPQSLISGYYYFFFQLNFTCSWNVTQPLLNNFSATFLDVLYHTAQKIKFSIKDFFIFVQCHEKG